MVKSEIGASTGGSFTGVTVSRNELVAIALPSLIMMLIVAEPFWLVNGVIVTVRLLLLPPKTIPDSGTRLVFELAAPGVRLEAGVSTSPITNASGPATLSSSIVTLVIVEMVGTLLTPNETEAELFPLFGSSIAEETVAVLVFGPAVIAVAWMVIVARPPLVREPTVQTTVPL